MSGTCGRVFCSPKLKRTLRPDGLPAARKVSKPARTICPLRERFVRRANDLSAARTICPPRKRFVRCANDLSAAQTIWPLRERFVDLADYDGRA